jgi:hypothetical protein
MPEKDSNQVWVAVLTPEEEECLNRIKESLHNPQFGGRIYMVLGKDKFLLQLIERLMPLAEVGQAVRKGLKETSRIRRRQYQRRLIEYQIELEKLHRENPKLSYTKLTKAVAKQFGVCHRTIMNHTQDPKNIL